MALDLSNRPLGHHVIMDWNFPSHLLISKGLKCWGEGSLGGLSSQPVGFDAVPG